MMKIRRVFSIKMHILCTLSARGIFKNQKSWLKAKPIWQEPIVLKEPINDDPVPWYPAKRQTPPPIISLPEKRPPFVDKKVYQWERKGFIPYFEKLYPYPVVEVEVWKCEMIQALFRGVSILRTDQ